MRRSLRRARRTKIVCTIGPATESREALSALAEAGMSVARLNFSHGEPEWHRERITLIREIALEHGRPIGILLDCPGPKLRVGTIENGPVELKTGARFRLIARDVPGNADQVSVDYPRLPDELHRGDRVFLADGVVELEVEESQGEEIVCRVVSGGPLSSRKGMNFPTRTLSVPSITDRDREAIKLGVQEGVDFIALSFIRTAEDVRLAKQVMLSQGGVVPVVAKIEKHEALENLADIVAEADGLLVARGDLAVEIPLEEVPQVQKKIIRAANDAGKPVITATQMLRSMVAATRPTRAETTDVANALYDGTDAVMLSEETAVGEHPTETVNIMRRICTATERDILRNPDYRRLPEGRRDSVPDVVAAAAVLVASHLKADAIVVPTRTGSTAIKTAEFRPRQPILAISTHPLTVGRLTLSWGVIPLQGNEVPSHEAMLDEAERVCVAAGLIEEGDLVVITAGFPVGGPGTTNTVTVKAIGERLSDGWTGDATQQRDLFRSREES